MKEVHVFLCLCRHEQFGFILRTESINFHNSRSADQRGYKRMIIYGFISAI